jgi:eukaryotic-like serine/threonine-protein kinase
MDTPVGLACFEMERRALALMDHPNIARVLEAGATPSGLPYFVMEWVQGTKITDYCDEHRLDLSRRLDLFVRICNAVQHAHQKGIIHRDIKPSNILVTLQDGESVPKLIDFGIALPTEGVSPEISVDSETLRPVGTPAYMSPEQAAGDNADIDTRSDIYSLGVLLCELLAGRPPVTAANLPVPPDGPRPPSALLAELDPQAQEVLASRRGTSPRKLIPALRGDLDWALSNRERARFGCRQFPRAGVGLRPSPRATLPFG